MRIEYRTCFHTLYDEKKPRKIEIFLGFTEGFRKRWQYAPPQEYPGYYIKLPPVVSLHF